MDGLKWKNPLKWMIWGYPYFWKHPYILQYCNAIKNYMGPHQRTLKQVARAIKYSGLGVRLVGPVGDFLDYCRKP